MEVLTLSEVTVVLAECGATWHFFVRGEVKMAAVRVSLTSTDCTADIALEFENRHEVLLDEPEASGVDRRDYYHSFPRYGSSYFLVVEKEGAAVEIPLLDATATFNNSLREWGRLDEKLRDQTTRAEVCVGIGELCNALHSLGISDVHTLLRRSTL